MNHWTENHKVVKALNLSAAGTSTLTSSAIDTLGYEGCVFVLQTGGITAGAVTSLKLQQSSDDAGSDDYSDILGSSQAIADDDDNELFVVPVHRPGKRYLKLVVSRATQNAEIGGVTAILYGPERKPVTQPTGTNAPERFHTPSEGTA